MTRTIKEKKDLIKIIKQLPVFRWGLYVVVWILLGLAIYYFFNRNEIVYTILFTLSCFFIFYICMRPAILYPKKHNLAWLCFVLVLGLFLWNCWWDIIKCFRDGDLFTMRKIFLWLIASFPVLISLFVDRTEDNDKKNVFLKRVRSIFFMFLSSVVYVLSIYVFGVRGVEFAKLVPFFLMPLYIICFSLWLYRGWSKKKLYLGIILSSLIAGSSLAFWILS